MSGSEYLVGPAIAMAAVGVLCLILRWIYSDGERKPAARRPTAGRDSADFGLLVPVANIAERTAAESLRDLLAGHGVRATLASAVEGGTQVLVFRSDESRARSLLTRSN